MAITKWDALKTAVHGHEVDTIKQLLEEIDIKQQGEGAISLLHTAIHGKAPREIFRLLLIEFKRKGISLEGVSESGKTPLDSACLSDNILAIELLIKAGADYKRKRFAVLEETCLDAFLEKNPHERDRIREFIRQRLEDPRAVEAEILQQEEPDAASKVSQRLQTTEAEVEKSCAPSPERNSLFNMIGGLFNQFRGYIKVPTDDVGNKKKAFKKSSGNHPKTD